MTGWSGSSKASSGSPKPIDVTGAHHPRFTQRLKLLRQLDEAAGEGRARVDYYKPRRSHMGREHLPPVREQPEEIIQIDRDQLVVRSYVGGLV